MIEKLDGMTKDLVKENIEKLKELFPTIIKEDKIDFEELELLLGEEINRNKEQYSFVWNGKTEATKLAQKRSTGTLRPCEKESKNWDTTKNIYIEGDNLEVLKLLQSSYNGRIKMIYIDPPYNTGHDFVYKDNFEDNIAKYKEVTGQVQKSNADTDGRYHTNWLNMMYPRLKLARNLLKDDGVIFISIDDSEQANLKKVCDEIFGEDNFVANVIWKRKRGRDNSAKWFSKSHEYLIIYAKNKPYFDTNRLELDEETKLAYKNPDNDPRGPYRMLGTWARGTQGGVKYDFTTKSGQYFSERLWLFSKENLIKLDLEDKLIIRGDNIYRKMFIDENEGKIPETIWDNVSNAANASDEIKRLFGSIVFDTPKPTPYIKEMLKIATKENDIILDFFSGSATLASAVFEQNVADNGKRKFICVQLPEQLAEDSEAVKLGYKNICEIGKERIRRAGDKIVDELRESMNYESKDAVEHTRIGNPMTNLSYTIKDENGDLKTFVANAQDPKDYYKFNPNDLDIGFKVFKLDSSNLKKWNNSPTKDANEIAQRIQISLDYLENGRNDNDLVYEIMLKYGLDLSLPVTKTNNQKAFIVNGEDYKLLICSQINLTLEDIEEFANESVGTYLFADRCFSDDNLLINTQEILKAKNKEMRLF